MDSRPAFLAGSIADIQATIRAVDVKITALMVLLVVPLQNLHRVFGHLKHFTHIPVKWPAFCACGLFLLAWFFAFVALVRAIAAIDNPMRHIKDNLTLTGSYFSGGLFKLTFVDAFLNRSSVLSEHDPLTVQARLPVTPADVEAELVFEQMKLVYIRDMKLHRLYWGLVLSLIWLALGIAIFISSKFVID